MANMDLPTARASRTALITRINNFIEWTASNEMRDLDFFDIKARMDRYQANFGTLENANAIVAGATEVDADRNAVWEEFYVVEDRFLVAYATVNRRFVELTPQVAPIPVANADAAGGAIGGADDQVNRQPIMVQMAFQPQSVQQTWGTFNGNVLDWQDFRARFELAVHNRADIPAEYKLSYLRNALKGQAAEASRGWSLKAENYQKAWDELVANNTKRYPLASAYLSRFFAIQPIGEGATAAKLQKLSNETNELVRQLHDLDYPVEHYNLIIVHALQSRLNSHYVDKWEMERKGNDDPTIEQMTKFLDFQATNMVTKGLVYSNLQVSVPNERASRSRLQSVVHRASTASRSGDSQAYPCGACGKFDHLVYKCPEFKPLSVKERMKVVLLNGMCMNCLKRGHQKDNCFDQNRCLVPECKRDDRHNSMLCPFKSQPHHAMTVNCDDQSSSSSHDSQAIAYRAGHGRGRGTPFKRPGDSRS